MKSSDKTQDLANSDHIDISQIKGRKTQHVRISLTQDVQCHRQTTAFEDIHLIHRAAPEINFDDIDLTTELFGKELKAPIIISAMTGGNPSVTLINQRLAEVAAEYGLGMGVGSQRAAIEDPSSIESFEIARKKAPDSLLIGNIGAGQLAEGWGLLELQQAIDMIQADVLAIHLNPLHEAIQPEGECVYRGVIKKIKSITKTHSTPFIAKETGAGISREVALKLEKAGIRGFEIAGAGGTSFSAVESYRAKESGNQLKEKLGHLFWDWGIPTAISTVEVRSITDLPVISSGGIRNGVMAAKAFALGADAVGIALPFLQHAMDKNVARLPEYIEQLLAEIKTVMFLIGAETPKDLQQVDVVITGHTQTWLSQRGIDIHQYAQRDPKWHS